MTEYAPQLLTYKKAAGVLQVCERTVYTLVKEGQLPAVRFGRTVRIDQDDLHAFIDRAKTRRAKGGDPS